jgi:hypothetical protein
MPSSEDLAVGNTLLHTVLTEIATQRAGSFQQTGAGLPDGGGVAARFAMGCGSFQALSAESAPRPTTTRSHPGAATRNSIACH